MKLNKHCLGTNMRPYSNLEDFKIAIVLTKFQAATNFQVNLLDRKTAWLVGCKPGPFSSIVNCPFT